MATIRYFAAAAEAAGVASETVAAATLGDLVTKLTQTRDDRFAQVFGRCSVLVDGANTSDPATPLAADAKVDVLPPFAGG